MGHATTLPIGFETHPDHYKHWQLNVDGPIATLSMDVREDAGLSPDYRLKLNSYDLGVDIELADAVQRIRFEQPAVRTVLVTSLKERIFCAGANIMMLREASHGLKVNFCKFTNETRLAIEDASQSSGLTFLAALNGICAGGGYEVALAFNREKRTADLTVHAPSGPQPSSPDEILKAGDQFWPLRAFRELDDALLRLRLNEPEIGTIVIRTEGDRETLLAIDRTLVAHQSHWAVREIILLMKRTLKRLDLPARSFFALIDPGSAFAGSLFELALAADRSYMLDDPAQESFIALSPMNGGLLPMSNGVSRLQGRFSVGSAKTAAPAADHGRF